MAFSAKPIDKVPNKIGDRKIIVGKWSSDGGSTGGAIDTGLRVCEHLILQPVGTAVTSQPVVSSVTAFPMNGSSIKIVTVPDGNGLYIAYGR